VSGSSVVSFQFREQIGIRELEGMADSAACVQA